MRQLLLALTMLLCAVPLVADDAPAERLRQWRYAALLGQSLDVATTAVAVCGGGIEGNSILRAGGSDCASVVLTSVATKGLMLGMRRLQERRSHARWCRGNRCPEVYYRSNRRAWLALAVVGGALGAYNAYQIYESR